MPNGHHISELFDLPKDARPDFFDANLVFDSPVFIDPFLIKNSAIKEEAVLFERFGDYFQFVFEQSLELSLNRQSESQFRRLLAVREPKNINMGYTAGSNAGHGPSLSDKLLSFFVDVSARRFVEETDAFPGRQYNPVSLQVFTTGIGPDGISDITANLIMDYLVEYTRQQAREWNIPLVPGLALNTDGFDFEEMRWRGGGYYELPENPIREGEPLIFVPKRLLRGLDDVHDNTTSKVVSILRNDPELSIRFHSLINKRIVDVSIEEIRNVFKKEKSVHYRYLEILEDERTEAYDFRNDPLNLLADKTYKNLFDADVLPRVTNCRELKALAEYLINRFDRENSLHDGWKDTWKESTAPYLRPQIEPVIGRKFRAMGFTLAGLIPDITFTPEAGTGNGSLDFQLVYKDCKIAIELKLLKNSSPKGNPALPAYIHGLKRQLPQYADSLQAKHAYYVTGLHYDGTLDVKKNDRSRESEIDSLVPEIQEELRNRIPGFDTLNHVCISMVPRESASDS